MSKLLCFRLANIDICSLKQQYILGLYYSLAPVKNISNKSYNYVLPTTWSYTKINPPKNFSAILAGSIWQDKSAHAAWVKSSLTQAGWADLSCHIEPAEMAEKFLVDSFWCMIMWLAERNCI